jgi:AraC family transcriptional regulator
MSAEPALTLDFSKPDNTSLVLPRPPIISSHQSGWKNIHLNHFQLPQWEMPEVVGEQQTISLFSPRSATAMEIIHEGRTRLLPQPVENHILLMPRDLPSGFRWNNDIEFTTCHIESKCFDRIAYESVNPDRVELLLTLPPTTDPLVWQLVMVLKHTLETNPTNSCFYAESLTTALAAHLLQHYATRTHVLRKYRGGLPQPKLAQALEYINEHLSEDLSLETLAIALNISQYYLCRLFKQSIGMSPHAYLVKQRVERSKQLLKDKDNRILDVAIACGFANPSHFAKCFRQQLGITPSQFQRI